MSDASTPEHRPLLRGQGRFLDDLGPASGALELAFVRSPWPHARIRSIEAGEARRVPGVAAVVTGADLAGTVAPIRTEMASGGKALFRATDWHPVAPDTVRYTGEIVAVVAAERADILPRMRRPSSTSSTSRCRWPPMHARRHREDAPLVHEHAPGERAVPHRVVVRRAGAVAVRPRADPGPHHVPPSPRFGHADGGDAGRRRRFDRDERNARILLVHPGAPPAAGRPCPQPRGSRRAGSGSSPRTSGADSVPKMQLYAGGGGGGRACHASRPPRQVGPGSDGAPAGGVPLAGCDRSRLQAAAAGGRPPRGPPGTGALRRGSVLRPFRSDLFARSADGRGRAPRAVPGPLLPLHRRRCRHQQVSNRGVPRGGLPLGAARDRDPREPDRPRRGSRPDGSPPPEPSSPGGASARESRRGGVRQRRLSGALRGRPRSRALHGLARRAAAPRWWGGESSPPPARDRGLLRRRIDRHEPGRVSNAGDGPYSRLRLGRAPHRSRGWGGGVREHALPGAGSPRVLPPAGRAGARGAGGVGARWCSATPR